MLHVLCQTSNYAQYPRYGFNSLKKKEHHKKLVIKSSEEKQRLTQLWQELVKEILAVPHMTLEILARDLKTSLDTVKRIQSGETTNPRTNLVRGLFVVHMIYRPDRYGQTPFKSEWLQEQGWNSTL